MNLRKFYLDLTLLWCLSVVSVARVRYRKCPVTSMVCASRQPLHWAAPSAWSSVALIACRSSAFGKPLMWWMNEGHRAPLWAPIMFLFSHHIANTNLDRQRQTGERPISHSPSQKNRLWSPAVTYSLLGCGGSRSIQQTNKYFVLMGNTSILLMYYSVTNTISNRQWQS